jgi:hypothetical protein
MSLPPAERLERLREPEIREAILTEQDPPDRPNVLSMYGDRTGPAHR